ncbi:MAG: transcription factor [Caldivirga sp.]|jgi:hypothetical protein
MSSEQPEEAEEEGEEIERESATSELVTEAGKRIVKIKLSTGKTSAGKLFGRHGRGGRPDFFRIIFGAVANGLRTSLGGEEGEARFNELRNRHEFRESLTKVFNDIKNWFFTEVTKQYDIGKGDVFAILTELDLDLETGELRWVKENSQVIYWVRSDKIKAAESCGKVEEELKRLKEDYDKLREENLRLKSENEALSRELADIKARLSELLKLLGSSK